jgi:hypothetical protein
VIDNIKVIRITKYFEKIKTWGLIFKNYYDEKVITVLIQVFLSMEKKLFLPISSNRVNLVLWEKDFY